MSYKTGFYEGRLGIGLRSTMGMGDGNPRYPLDINGDIRLTGSIVNGAGQVLSLVQSESLWTIGNSNLSYTGGNVGIGTTSPQTKLDIKVASSASGGYDRINISDTQLIAEFGRNNAEGSGFLRLQNNGSHSVLIQGNSLSYFNGGNVGIGTTSPDYPLHCLLYTSPSPRDRG